MDKETLELILRSVGALASPVASIAQVVITSLFLRKNTDTLELEKIKANKLSEAVNDLLDNGKITYQEFISCKNFLSIAKKADEFYGSQNRPEYSLDNLYWFYRFYDYAGKISNEDLQQIWAAVLAREVQDPGKMSLSLLSSLFIMSREQAILFEQLCQFVLNDINHIPMLLLFIQSDHKTYEQFGITYSNIKEMERLGLVECDFKDEFVYYTKKIFRTGNKNIVVYGDPNNRKKIKAGNVNFTKDGMLLYDVVDGSFKEYRGDILDFIVDEFKRNNCRVIINDKEV